MMARMILVTLAQQFEDSTADVGDWASASTTEVHGCSPGGILGWDLGGCIP